MTRKRYIQGLFWLDVNVISLDVNLYFHPYVWQAASVCHLLTIFMLCAVLYWAWPHSSVKQQPN